MAETVRRSVLKLKPPRGRKVASVMSILVALCWGVLAGLVVCVPLGYYYRFWRESNPLRGNLDYTRASVGEINRDWDLLQRVQRYATDHRIVTHHHAALVPAASFRRKSLLGRLESFGGGYFLVRCSAR